MSAQVAQIESQQMAKGGRAEVQFECSRLEADEKAEEFIAKFLPALQRRDAVGTHHQPLVFYTSGTWRVSYLFHFWRMIPSANPPL